MAKVADEVTLLQNICGIGAARCQAALDANGGDVGRAMRALIARGEVTADLLNPEHATDEHYALAQAKKLLTKQEAFSPDRRKLLSITDAEMNELRDQLSGKIRLTAKLLESGQILRYAARGEQRPTPSKEKRPAPVPVPSPPFDSLAPLEQLRRMCFRTPEQCQAALDANGGDVDKALRSMIATGIIPARGLDAEVTTDEHFALMQIQSMLAHPETLTPDARKHFRIDEGRLQSLRDQLAGRIPIDARLMELAQSSRDARLGPKAPKRPKPKPRVVRIKPFPRLTQRGGGDWEGTDVLPSWKGFQSRGGGYTSRDSDRPSSGKIDLVVTAPSSDAYPAPPPATEQVAAYRYLKEHEAAVAEAIVAAIFAEYTRLRGLTEADEAEFVREFMPDIKRKDDLRDMIGLGIVHVLSVAKDGHAYIGFEMGCTWDEEHGVGVMTHMGRVVAVGQGDMGFDGSAAENDGGQPINA